MGAIVKCVCGVSIDITGATPRLDGIKVWCRRFGIKIGSGQLALLEAAVLELFFGRERFIHDFCYAGVVIVLMA